MRFALFTSLVALAILTGAAPQPPVEKVGGTSIPIFKRFSLMNEDKTVNVKALHSHIANTRAKILRGFENFERNTGITHPSALKMTKRQGYTGVVNLTSDEDLTDYLWYGHIDVGSQTFTVVFDTGSGDLVLPWIGCGSSCIGHTLYNPGNSSTSHFLEKSYTLKYGKEISVNVEEYTDDLSIAGFTVDGQALGAATQYTPSLSLANFPPDGVLGMAFQAISVANEPPPFQNLVSRNILTYPMFSFKLAQSGSEMFVGDINRNLLHIDSLVVAYVTQAGFWQVNMDGIQGNGQTIQSNVDSIIDTGTSLLIGVPSDVQNLMNILGGQPAPSSVGVGFYTFPCNSFPSISLTFKGESFPILESALNLGPVSSGSPECLCGIVGQDTGSSFWTIGNVFLQGVYTVFEMSDRPFVGFANLQV